MPRAFLITHRRYNGTEEFQTTGRDYSPERGVRLAEYGGGQPTSDGVSDCGSETSSECPEELYNLTKLAEVSLAAAAGTLIHPAKILTYQDPLSTRWDDRMIEKYTINNITEDKSCTSLETLSSQRRDDLKHEVLELDEVEEEEEENDDEDEKKESELSLRERTRLFFERIECERDKTETRDKSRNSTDLPKVRETRETSLTPRLNRENDDISSVKLSKASFGADEIIEESSKSASTTLTRRGIFASSSEGSRSDDSEDHECPDCGKKYSTSSNLARHRQTHRSLGDKKARRCPHCDKIYVSMPAFSMHVRTHNQGCKCHYCGKCFSRPWLLQGHIRTHTGEKPFKCTICNKAFADKSNLRAHVQTHSNTKPHVCGRCGKAFALKSYLYKHEESSCMRAHHRGSLEKSETSNESCVVNVAATEPAAVASLKTSLPIVRIVEPIVTASPTSVIVQRPGATRETINSSPMAFSTIIRHTKNQLPCRDISTSPLKRHCRDKISTTTTTTTSENEQRAKDSEAVKSTDFLSRMVIRTSVISTNPANLSRLGETLSSKKAAPFDFTDPTRTSAFSRPNAIGLNLGIA